MAAYLYGAGVGQSWRPRQRQIYRRFIMGKKKGNCRLIEFSILFFCFFLRCRLLAPERRGGARR
jgi:hypothetical protein